MSHNFTVELNVQQGTLIVTALAALVIAQMKEHGESEDVLDLMQMATSVNRALSKGLGVENIGANGELPSGPTYSLTAGQVALLLVATKAVHDRRDQLSDEAFAELCDGLDAAMRCEDLTNKQAYNVGAALGMIVESLLAKNPDADREAKDFARNTDMVAKGLEHLRSEKVKSALMTEPTDADLETKAEEVADALARIMGFERK